MSTRTVSDESAVYEWTCDGCSKAVTFTAGHSPEEWLRGSLSSPTTYSRTVLVCSLACFHEAVGVRP